ncbi:MAG: hypothetical protein INR73_22280 [Williamsia sp.]|nr:hypothetical protein [Williamsia sp.]
MTSPFRAFFPLLVEFILVSLFLLLAVNGLRKWEINQGLVLAGNCILFLVTVASFFLFRRALSAPNTHSFLRNVYSALGVKFFVLIAIAFVYIYAAGNTLNKAGFLFIAALYFLYMFSEVAILMNLSRQIRQRKNA